MSQVDFRKDRYRQNCSEPRSKVKKMKIKKIKHKLHQIMYLSFLLFFFPSYSTTGKITPSEGTEAYVQ